MRKKYESDSSDYSFSHHPGSWKWVGQDLFPYNRAMLLGTMIVGGRKKGFAVPKDGTCWARLSSHKGMMFFSPLILGSHTTWTHVYPCNTNLNKLRIYCCFFVCWKSDAQQNTRVRWKQGDWWIAIPSNRCDASDLSDWIFWFDVIHGGCDVV